MGRDLKPIIVRVDKNPRCPVCNFRACESGKKRCYECYEADQWRTNKSAMYAYFPEVIDPEGLKYVSRKRKTG